MVCKSRTVGCYLLVSCPDDYSAQQVGSFPCWSSNQRVRKYLSMAQALINPASHVSCTLEHDDPHRDLSIPLLQDRLSCKPAVWFGLICHVQDSELKNSAGAHMGSSGGAWHICAYVGLMTIHIAPRHQGTSMSM